MVNEYPSASHKILEGAVNTLGPTANSRKIRVAKMLQFSDIQLTS